MDIEWDVSKLTASQKKIADFIEKSGEHILYYSEKWSSPKYCR